MKEKDPRLLLL